MSANFLKMEMDSNAHKPNFMVESTMPMEKKD